MSTDITLHDGAQRDMTTPAPHGVSDPTGGRLVAWAEGLAAAHRIGAALCQTSFVPQHFRGKPEEAAAAILYGDEIGFTPTQSLQNLYVISGKPALYARAMVAIVQAAGHTVYTVEKTDESVTVAGVRRGTSQEVRETWDIKRAQRAGYTNNKKYQSDPQAMLYARAASDVCRQIAADALAGIGYSVEEMNLVEESAQQQTPKPTGSAALRAALTPAKTEEPVVEPAPDESPAQEGWPNDLTDRTRKQLFALFTQKGITEKDKQLAGIRDVIGRPIASRSELTEDEAQACIERLRTLPDAEATA